MQYSERIRDMRSLLHVEVRSNDRGIYLEMKLPNHEAINDVHLKIPGDKGMREGWQPLACKLKKSPLDGFIKADLEMEIFGDEAA